MSFSVKGHRKDQVDPASSNGISGACGSRSPKVDVNTYITDFRGLCLAIEDRGIMLAIFPNSTRSQYPIYFSNRIPKTPHGVFAFMSLLKKEVSISNMQSHAHERAYYALKTAITPIAKPFDPVMKPRNTRGKPTGKEIT
jgi:hypothetical protein